MNTNNRPAEQMDVLAEMEWRASAATAGPLIVRPEGGGWNAEARKWNPAVTYEDYSYVAGFSVRGNGNNDAEFFAHAREDVLSLISEIRRLRAIEAAARDAADNYYDIRGIDERLRPLRAALVAKEGGSACP